MRQPILRNVEMEKLRQAGHEIFATHTIDVTWPTQDGPAGMAARLAAVCDEAYLAIEEGVEILILSDRRTDRRRAPIPSLLAVAAVHHHLVRAGNRLRAGLVLESGEPREVHHMATLIGYGASAINPYLLFDTVDELVFDGRVGGVHSDVEGERNVVKAIGKGLLKTISKMGISTIQSYCGAQIFEAVGLARDLVDRHFAGTASRIGGIGMDVLARESLGPSRARVPARGRATCCPSAASTRGAATASTTCGTRRRSGSCSTPRGPPTATGRRSTTRSRASSTRTPRAGRRCAGS